MKIRIAWKLRVAGWIRLLSVPGLPRGITEAIRSASCAVRVNGCSSRRATIVRAIRRAHPLLAVGPQHVGDVLLGSRRDPLRGALATPSGSMRMSSGPSLPKLKPRSATSSCGDDTPGSKRIPSRPPAVASHRDELARSCRGKSPPAHRHRTHVRPPRSLRDPCPSAATGLQGPS